MIYIIYIKHRYYILVQESQNLDIYKEKFKGKKNKKLKEGEIDPFLYQKKVKHKTYEIN